MSKELPYFKFHCDQWLGKKITLESYELQGVFINVCAIYWANDCDIKIATLSKRYGEAINILITEGYIKDKNGIAKISFLDSQWQERHKIHKENSNNGKAGAKARWDKHREANGEANGEAKENNIAIRKDKIIEDNKRKDNIIDIYFEDFKNSSYLEDICKRQKVTKEQVLNKLEDFKLKMNLEYKDYLDFCTHFKNWFVKLGVTEEKKEYLLTSAQGKHKFLFTEAELAAKKLSGYWKEQHEL